MEHLEVWVLDLRWVDQLPAEGRPKAAAWRRPRSKARLPQPVFCAALTLSLRYQGRQERRRCQDELLLVSSRGRARASLRRRSPTGGRG